MVVISETLFLNLPPRADLVREEPMTEQHKTGASTFHKPGPWGRIPFYDLCGLESPRMSAKISASNKLNIKPDFRHKGLVLHVLLPVHTQALGICLLHSPE